MEVVTDLWIEARAAGDQVTHPGAKSVVQLAEEDTARIESDSPQTTIERHQYLQTQTRHAAAFGYFFKDAFVDQIKELGHDSKDSDLALVQCPEQFRGVQCF